MTVSHNFSYELGNPYRSGNTVVKTELIFQTGQLDLFGYFRNEGTITRALLAIWTYYHALFFSSSCKQEEDLEPCPPQQSIDLTGMLNLLFPDPFAFTPPEYLTSISHLSRVRNLMFQANLHHESEGLQDTVPRNV